MNTTAAASLATVSAPIVTVVMVTVASSPFASASLTSDAALYTAAAAAAAGDTVSVVCVKVMTGTVAVVSVQLAILEFLHRAQHDNSLFKIMTTSMTSSLYVCRLVIKQL